MTSWDEETGPAAEGADLPPVEDADLSAQDADPAVEDTDPPRRWRVLGALGLAVAVAAGGLWWTHGPWNVFERMMWHQWALGPEVGVDFDGPYENVTKDPDLAGHRAEMQYWSEGLHLTVTIRAETDGSECDAGICHTTWWKSLFPVWMRVGYSEVVDAEFGYYLSAEYDRRGRVLTQSVGALGADGFPAEVPDVGAYLAERGVTREDLRAKMDWLLNERALPDFLPTFPGWGYSADYWGDVTVVRDEALS